MKDGGFGGGGLRIGLGLSCSLICNNQAAEMGVHVLLYNIYLILYIRV
jgi:hypothetical protein